MLVDDGIWLYGRGVEQGDIVLADAARILVTLCALPPGTGEVLTEADAQAALLQWRTRPVTCPRSGGNHGVSGTELTVHARVPAQVAFMLVPFDDLTAAALSRRGGAPIRDAMASAADAAGDDVAWFCWNLGRRLYAIESALPFQMMPGDLGPRDPDVAALSRWIGSLMTLLIHHARYLDPTRPFPPGWPAPNESPSRKAPPYFPGAPAGAAPSGLATPL